LLVREGENGMPLLFDMPLEELRDYQGVNPCPKDFDSYWDTALAEMKETDPELKLLPSDFQVSFAECFDLYFTGVRNARIHAKYLRPKDSQQNHPAILKFHGYGRNAGDWSNMLSYAANGYSVVALDCRGQGGCSEDVGGVYGNTHRGHIIRGLGGASENLLYRHMFLDTAQLAGIVMSMPEVDRNRIGAIGVSQGGGLAIACAALEPGIKKVAPQLAFLSDYRRVWDMCLGDQAYEELYTYFRLFDPLHEREDDIFTQLGYIDVQHLAQRIRGEVLMATALRDPACLPSTQFAAYNKIKSSKHIVLYPDFGHEELPGFADKEFQFMAEL